MQPRTHGSVVQHGGDAEDVVFTDVRHGAFDDAPAALQTSVALEHIPRSLTVDPVEHVQLPDPRHQHQLCGEWMHHEERNTLKAYSSRNM